MAIDIIARGMIESSKTDISQLFDITKGGEIVNNESSYTLNAAVDYPLLGLNLYGKSTQDGVPTPENPVEIVSVGDSDSVMVTACGKNLCEHNVNDDNFDGLSIKSNSDGSITINGTITHGNWIIKLNKVYLIKGNQYYFSFFGGVSDNFSLQLEGAGYTGAKIGRDKLFTFNYPTGFYNLRFGTGINSAGAVIDNITAYPLFMAADTEDKSFEPYKGSTATITSALPLCGIPVSEGGNYTDTNGQQWVCDELVYNADGTGKVVKRTAVYAITEDTKVGFLANSGSYQRATVNLAYSNIIAPKDGMAMCSAYRYNTYFRFVSTTQSIDDYAGCFGIVNGGASNINIRFATTATTAEQFISENLGVKIIYQRAEPQEIELTASEMTALRQLQTFDGVSNISNDSGADMDVSYCTNKLLSEYVFPITTGLQAQIDELKAAVLSLGGNV